MTWRRWLWLAVCACGGDAARSPVGETSTAGATSTDTATTTASTTLPGTSSGTSEGTADTTTGEPTGPWEPGDVYPTPTEPNARGFLERRGIIHAHSVYSGDACDGAPMDAEGNIDPVCYEDL